MWWLQDLEKRDAVAEKKRESIMVNFNQTKGQMSSLENALKTVQVDLEKTQFALEVKKGEQICLLQMHIFSSIFDCSLKSQNMRMLRALPGTSF